MNNYNFLSLYDYLGHAAGPKLGRLVNEYAKIRKNIPTKLKQINNPKYNGYVFTYPKEFLDEFFATTKLIDNYYIERLNEAEEELKEINSLLMQDAMIMIEFALSENEHGFGLKKD